MNEVLSFFVWFRWRRALGPYLHRAADDMSRRSCHTESGDGSIGRVLITVRLQTN